MFISNCTFYRNFNIPLAFSVIDPDTKFLSISASLYLCDDMQMYSSDVLSWLGMDEMQTNEITRL